MTKHTKVNMQAKKSSLTPYRHRVAPLGDNNNSARKDHTFKMVPV